MTEWGAIHTDTHISGTDGFSFLRFNGPEWDWSGKAIAEFIHLLMPNEDERPSAWKDVEHLVTQSVIAGGARELPLQALKMHLCNTMSGTFALGQEGRSRDFLVGATNPADLFKLKLKFAETEATKVWNSNTRFYVRVKKGEKFNSDGTAATGHRRQFSSEGW